MTPFGKEAPSISECKDSIIFEERGQRNQAMLQTHSLKMPCKTNRKCITLQLFIYDHFLRPVLKHSWTQTIAYTLSEEHSNKGSNNEYISRQITNVTCSHKVLVWYLRDLPPIQVCHLLLEPHRALCPPTPLMCVHLRIQICKHAFLVILSVCLV